MATAKTTTATGLTLAFQMAKETKNTYMFSELNEAGAVASSDEWMVGSLYVQKSFFTAKPDKVWVTLSATEPK
ncbi:MAG: hypothetical protein ACHQX3_00765 [Nitrospirales bacterium]